MTYSLSFHSSLFSSSRTPSPFLALNRQSSIRNHQSLAPTPWSLPFRAPFEMPRTFRPGPCHAAMDSFLRSPALGALSQEAVRCMLQWSREPKQDACGEEMTVYG